MISGVTILRALVILIHVYDENYQQAYFCMRLFSGKLIGLGFFYLPYYAGKKRKDFFLLGLRSIPHTAM